MANSKTRPPRRDPLAGIFRPQGPAGVEDLADAKAIRLDLIDPGPHQARTTFDETGLQELAASMRERGVLQPIRVRPVGARYELVAGERRWRAAKLAGLAEIPAIVRELTPEEAALDGLIENLQREDLNVVDRANGLRQLRLNLGSPSWEEVGRRVGLTKRRVLQLIDVEKLPSTVQQRVRGGELTEKHTRPLKGLPADRQEELAAAAAAETLTPDETARAARAMKEDGSVAAAAAVAKARAARSRGDDAPTPMPAVGAALPAGPDAAPSEARPAFGVRAARDEEVIARLAYVIAQLDALPIPQGSEARQRVREQWERIRALADDTLTALA